MGVGAGLTATSPELVDMQDLSILLSQESVAAEPWIEVLGLGNGTLATTVPPGGQVDRSGTTPPSDPPHTLSSPSDDDPHDVA
jgi:hypothetical protein